MSNTPITESKVKQFVRDWFHKLDKHPDLNEMHPFVAEQLTINMPDRADEPFEDWYRGAAKYRDQIHSVKALKIKPKPDAATVEVVVRWERSDSKSPSPGTRMASYAAQRWTLERSQQSPERLCIVEYKVDYLLDEIHPLADAIRQDDPISAVKHLLKQGYDVNKKDAAGFTPLMIAAGLGNVEMVQLLLDAGADVFITDSGMGTTALHKAAQCGSKEVAELLLDKGAFIDPQAPTLGNTPLLDAVWHKHKDMVACLLHRGARTELTTRSGRTPMDFAKSDGNEEVIGLLNTHDASIRQKKADQKLMDAVKANALNTVEKLIDAVEVDEKAPLTGDPFDGYTPLLTAAFLGYDEIVQKLLDAGADPTLVDDQIKATPAHKAGYHGKAKIAQVLVKKAVEKGLNLNAQGPYNGYTALHDAIWHCHKETVEVFLNAQVRLDLKTHTGHTALELAKRYCGSGSEIVTLIEAKEKTGLQ